jgi:glycosyltransferase involved in cell wall biosynthesis
MHILIVALHRPDKPTGVCRHAANLAQCLAETAAVTQVTLVTGTWQQHYFKTAFLLDSEKIKVLGIEIKNTSISRNLWFLFGLPKLVGEIHPDLVHLSFPLPFFRSRFSCPVVTTIHDLYPFRCPENFGYRQVLFNRLFLKQCISNSDGLTCVSQTTLDDLTAYFPADVAHPKPRNVIYNIVDFDRVTAAIPKNLKDNPDQPFILCVGQHRKNKNLDLLIKAFDRLRKENRIAPAVKLLLVGSLGPETEELMQLLQQLTLQDAVLMLSDINDRELCWLYQNCQLFVMASSLEGFCIPLVEALYFSCQVVCSDIPIFKEIGSSNCRYFDLTGDAIGNMAESMVQPLQSDKPEKNDDCSRFMKTEIAAKYLDFYGGVIKLQQIS